MNPNELITQSAPAVVPEPAPYEADGRSALPQRMPPTLQRSQASSRNGHLARGKLSVEGRSISRCNALRHGMFANVIPGWQLPGLANRQD